jgi:Ras-related protein Rab-18
MDVKVKMVEFDGQQHKLAIWDTAGQERFRTLTSSYYRGAQGIIFVYDITKRESFEHVISWLEEVNRFNTNPSVVLMLVGNKSDLPDRVVPSTEAAQWARKHNMMFLEASAKTHEGVEGAFMELLHAVINRQPVDEPQQSSKAVPIHREEEIADTYGCC